MTILNPEAIGDPNQTPMLQMSPALEAVLRPCKQRGVNSEWCGGVNGFHRKTCPQITGVAETTTKGNQS